MSYDRNRNELGFTVAWGVELPNGAGYANGCQFVRLASGERFVNAGTKEVANFIPMPA